MKRPEEHQGFSTVGNRRVEFWTRCENCREREECKRKHTCDHPGWVRLLVDGNDSVGWSGIITQDEIKRIHDYLFSDPPADVNYPPVKWQQTEMEI